MSNQIHVLITARLKSKRLKKKILLPFGEVPIITYLVRNLKRVFKNNITIITSKSNQDHVLEKIAKNEEIGIYRGEPQDVIKRIYNAAKKQKLSDFISCTADNPFTEPYYALKLYKDFKKNNYDFSTNNELPIGLFCNVCKTSAIKKIIKIKNTKNTEIWGSYFMDTNLFKVGNYKINRINKFFQKTRFTIDEKADYKFMIQIFDLIKNQNLNKNLLEKIILNNRNLILINNQVKQKKNKKIILKKKYKKFLVNKNY